MKFNIDNYEGKYVMHCKTEEETEDFCNYLHRMGRRWVTGDSYVKRTNYEEYQENTVYYFNNGTFGSAHVAELHEYKILEWSDFMNKEFTKEDLRTGDVVLFRNGNVNIVNYELDMLIGQNCWGDLSSYNDDLTSRCSNTLDIMEIRRPREKSDCQFKAFKHKWGILIYERKGVLR